MTGRMNRRSKDRKGSGTRLSWWERLMFSVMGPPELGEHRSPEGYQPDPAANECRKCGQSYDEHQRVNSGTFTYARCPGTQE